MVDVKEERIERQAMIFNVQKYSLYDGPGIRTIVFSKAVHCVASGVPIQKESSVSLKSCIKRACATIAARVLRRVL